MNYREAIKEAIDKLSNGGNIKFENGVYYSTSEVLLERVDDTNYIIKLVKVDK